MVAQKYGICYPLLPPRFALMVALNVLGCFVAILSEPLSTVVLPLSIGVLLVSTAGCFVEKARRLSFIIASLTIGLCIGGRIVLDLPMTSTHTYAMPGWLDGTIREVVSTSGRRMRCIIEGTLNLKFLPPVNGVRVSLDSKVLPHAPSDLVGCRVLASVVARIPRRSELPIGISEWQTAISNHTNLFATTIAGNVAFLPSNTRPIMTSVRAFLTKTIDSIYAKKSSQMLTRALVLGDRSLLERPTRELFSRTGTAHLLSVSGFHVGVVVAIVALLSAIVSKRLFRFVLFTVSIWAYVFLTGASPPTLRAGLAATLGAGMLYAQRWIHPIHGVILVLWGMLIIDPTILFSVSFQLSAAAIIGIVTIGLPLGKQWRKALKFLPRWIVTSIAITIGATLATAPLIAFYFGSVPIISVVANLAVVPLASAFIVTSIVSIIVGSLSNAAGQFYARVSEFLADSMLWTIERLARIDLSLSGPLLLPLSVGMICAVLYIIASKTSRHALFRSTISVLILIVFWVILECNRNLPSTIEIANRAIMIERRGDKTALITLRHAICHSHTLAHDIAEYCSRQSCTHVYVRVLTRAALPLAHRITERLPRACSTSVITQ